VVDASADETKAITFAELKSGLDTATGFVRITGDTMTGDLNGTNVTLSGYLRGPSSFTIDPAAHGDNTGTVVVAGNLQVDGTTTTINSTALDVDDLNITVASGAANAAAANGAGLTVDGASATFTYASTGDKWTMNKPLDVTGNIIVSGTVDGRDVAADGTKLDTVATSATANPNAIDNVVEDTTPQLGGDLASNGNDILFADNDKAIFGAGSDLQIFHTGLYSFISDQGTGGLYIDTNGSEIALRSNTGSENMLLCQQDGAVTLYYDNASKLATTSSGIDVTGTAVTDGVTVAGNLSVDGGTIKLDGNYPVGTGNVALGDAAMNGSISGNYNTAIGDYSMQPMTSGASNTGVGGSALRFVTSGSFNTAVGHQSLQSNTTASNNTAVGYQAGYSNTTGANVTAIGYKALYSATVNNNTAVGYNVASGTTSGQYNVAIGGNDAGSQTTFVANTTGSYNIAIGMAALRNNTTASYNTAVGYQSLYANTGGYNTAVGHSALKSNTTAQFNLAVGFEALRDNTTGADNTAIGGYQALIQNTTGSYNVAVGRGALQANTTASNNTAVGYQALYSNTTASNSTAVGSNTLDAVTTGNNNVAVGNSAGGAVTTGTDNTMMGVSCGELVTTGSKNTIIGRYNGNQGGLDIRTSSNNIVLSDGDGNPRVVVNSSGDLLVGATSTVLDGNITTNFDGGLRRGMTINDTASNNSANFVAFAKAGSEIGRIQKVSGSNSVNYSTTSDYRLKENRESISDGIARVKQLAPCKFNWTDYPAENKVDGFIAHEVQAIVPEAITGTHNEVDDGGNPVYQGIDQSKLVPLLTAALQEAIAKIETLEAKVTALENA